MTNDTMTREGVWIPIENDDIVLRAHGHHDGVHLNDDGSELLHRNLLFAFTVGQCYSTLLAGRTSTVRF